MVLLRNNNRYLIEGGSSGIDVFANSSALEIKENIEYISCGQEKYMNGLTVRPCNPVSDILVGGNVVKPHRHNKPKKAFITKIVPQGN